MPNSVTLEGKNIQTITQQEKEAVKNLLADHLLDFYYYYTKFAGLNYQSKQEALLEAPHLEEKILLLGLGTGGIIGAGTGAIIAGVPGAIIGGILGFFLWGQLSIYATLLYACLIGIYDCIAENSFNKKKNIGKRLQQIPLTEAPTKMKEIANDLVENQLMKENINLNQINLYQIASHAIAELKTSNHNEDVQTAMLRGAQQKRKLFSFPNNIWFWIKSLFMKSDQAFRLKSYFDVELNKPTIQKNDTLSNALIDLGVSQTNSNKGLTFFSPENKETIVNERYTPTPSPSHSSL